MTKPTKQQKRAKKLAKQKKAQITKQNELNRAINVLEELEQTEPMYGPDCWMGLESELLDDFDLLNLEGNACSCIVHRLLPAMAAYYNQRLNLEVTAGDWVVEEMNGDDGSLVVSGPFSSFDEAVAFAKEEYPDVKIFRSNVNGASVSGDVDYDQLIDAWTGDSQAWEKLYSETRHKFGYEFSAIELLEEIMDKIRTESPEIEDVMNDGDSVKTIVDSINANYNGPYKERLNLSYSFAIRPLHAGLAQVEFFHSDDDIDLDIFPAPKRLM